MARAESRFDDYQTRRRFLAGCSATVTLSLTGCGGGSQSAPVSLPGTPTPSPSPSPSPTPAPTSALRNLAVGSETFDRSPPFVASPGCSILASTIEATVDGRGVKLREVNFQSANSGLQYFAPTTSSFRPGSTLLISLFVKAGTPGDDAFLWDRLVEPGNPAPDPKLADGSVRRIWSISKAVTSTKVSPALAVQVSSSDPVEPWILLAGNGATLPRSVFAGGLQIEEIGNEVQGIVVVGDSTQNRSVLLDDPLTSVTPSKWLAALLNVPVYNRARSGATTTDLIAAWQADISPLARYCQYAVIQGGINDLRLGYTAEAIRANLSKLHDLAVRNGLVPAVCTITPATLIPASSEASRQELNAWIRSTFTRVIDLDKEMVSASRSDRLQSDNTIDGTHYSPAGIKLAGTTMASGRFWNFTRPSSYLVTA